ncbi:hypothetical protein THAOC_36439, partial [Thalassiosira oceanica]
VYIYIYIVYIYIIYIYIYIYINSDNFYGNIKWSFEIAEDILDMRFFRRLIRTFTAAMVLSTLDPPIIEIGETVESDTESRASLHKTRALALGPGPWSMVADAMEHGKS